MTSLPRRLPERGRNRGLYRWLNQLRDAVESRQLVPGVGTRISSSSKGTTVTAQPSNPTRRTGGAATWL